MHPCLDEQIGQKTRLPGLFEIRIARVVLVMMLGAVGAIPLVFLTPPFQVPDEVQHFYRAYQLSEFQLRAKVQDGVSGGILPESLPRLAQASVYTKDEIFYPAIPAPLAKTLTLASIPLRPSATQFVAFPGSAYYAPLPYVPEALGIAVGRVIGLGPLYLLYLGRLCNCLTVLALIGLAVYVIPAGEELIIFVGMLPMSLFLYASLSPDAAVIATALVFTSLTFSACAKGKWNAWELAIAAVAGAVFCSIKPVYAPMLLAGVVPGGFRPRYAMKAIRHFTILFAIPLGVAAGWLLFARSSMTTPLGGGHPSLQMAAIYHHPLTLIFALGHTLSAFEIFKLYLQAVGVLGWFTVMLHPGVVYLLPLICLVMIVGFGVRGTVEHSVLSAIWWIVLAFASSFLVIIALYLLGTKPGNDTIVVGLQGRYFIPIFALAGLAAIRLVAAKQPSSLSRNMLSITVAIVLLEIAATDVTMIRAFHLF